MALRATNHAVLFTPVHVSLTILEKIKAYACVYIPLPFWVEPSLNISELSPYLKGNTAIHYYKFKLIKAV
jgi:hypothetical protein